MISNVAMSKAEAAGSPQPPGEAQESGDTGVFDALLAQEAGASVDAAEAAANTALAGFAEDIELPSLGDESDDDTTDDADTPDDALWFVSALLPMPRVVVAHTPAAGAAPISTNTQGAGADIAAAVTLQAGAGQGTDLLPDPAGAKSGDHKFLAAHGAATPAIDTGSWNSLTGPAELFAQAGRHGTVERAESAPLTTHVRDPRWADDLGNRLASMVRTGESSASLQLTPVDLGPLEVNVSVRDSQATVHFGAANAETRALLEASMPRLREMLAAQGFQLMDSSVSHGFARQARHESAGTPRIDGDADVTAAAAQPIHISGLLDLYA